MPRPDKKSEPDEPGAPAWMVTYGDMMTLLLTFFVLLVSFSSIQLAEFEKAMGSLRGALGILKHRQSNVKLYRAPTPDIPRQRGTTTQSQIEELRSYLQEEGIEDQVSMRLTEKGVAVTIESPILFDLGRAELRSEFLPLLDRIGRMAKTTRSVVIEGHTDDLPIHNAQFRSNWELSAGRALSVLHYFEHLGVSPASMTAVGRGEYRPIAPNDSEKNRRKNRRVEIYLNFAD